MPFEWGRVVKSRQFKFIVGPNKDEFMVHSAAFTKLSSYFETLMNGEMAEARYGEVIWDDVEVDTFIRLSQFAYYGDYTIDGPDGRRGGQNADQGTDESDGLQTPVNPSRTAAEIQQRLKETSTARADFDQRLKEKTIEKSMTLQSWYNANKQFPESPIKEVTEFVLLETFFGSNYAPEEDPNSPAPMLEPSQVPRQCLDHVKVYVIGDRYMIDSLRTIALRKIHQTLQQTEMTSFAVAGPIAEMLRFAFEKTADKDELRALLVSYSTCIYDVYIFHPDFWQVLQDVGELSAQILRKRLYPFGK